MFKRKQYWFEQVVVDTDGKFIGTTKTLAHNKKELKTWERTLERVVVVQKWR